MTPPRRDGGSKPPAIVLLDASPEETAFEDFHIEALRVRSVKRNWTIPEHVHYGLHQVFALEQGGMNAVIDGEALYAKAPAILYRCFRHGPMLSC